MSRGLRNNNPGNIEAGIPWQGLAKPHEMSPAQKAEPRFAVFRSPEWGVRAMVRILQTYRGKYGIDTIAGIINRWAPPSDNNPTHGYARAVASEVGVGVDMPINTADPDTLLPLLRGMIRFENGETLPDSTIKAGIALANLGPASESAPKPVKKSKRVKGAVVAGGAGAVTILAQASDVLRSAKGIIAEFTGLDPVIWPGIAWVLGLGFAAFVLYVLWTVYVDYQDKREPEEPA